MIKLIQPSLALHSHDVPGYKYRMKETWKMPKGASPSDVIYWIQYAYDQTDYGLHNVVINCHGGDGKLYVGGDGQPTMNNYNVGLFSQIKNKVSTIWLVACKVAQTASGRYFCQQMAQLAKCNVVAADISQYVDATFYLRFCPKNCVDDYEGTTYCWDSQGNETKIAQDGSGVSGTE